MMMNESPNRIAVSRIMQKISIAVDLPKENGHVSKDAWKNLKKHFPEKSLELMIRWTFNKGAHCILNVVGESEEAGWQRLLFRTGTFSVPHGVMSYNHNLRMNNRWSTPSKITTEVIHGLLIDAACYGLADPIEPIEGIYFPSIFQLTLHLFLGI